MCTAGSSGKVTTGVMNESRCAGNLQQQQRRGPQPRLMGLLRAPPQTHSPCASSCCLCLCFCSCCGCGCDAAARRSLWGPWSFWALWSAAHVWRGGLCCLLGMDGDCCSAAYNIFDGCCWTHSNNTAADDYDHDADGHRTVSGSTNKNDMLTMLSAHNRASLISTMPLKRALHSCQVSCQLRRAEHVHMGSVP